MSIICACYATKKVAAELGKLQVCWCLLGAMTWCCCYQQIMLLRYVWMSLQVLGTIKNAVVVWIGIIFLQELVTKLQVILKQCSYALSDLCSSNG